MTIIDSINNKIREADEILTDFGLERGRLQALTLIALCGIEPEDAWENAERKSLGLSNDIMEFVNSKYSGNYKPNSRESFRKNALKPFVDAKVAELNPDDPTLSTTSSKTHYAITPLAINTIKKFGTPEWEISLDNFLKYTEKEEKDIRLISIKISGYKSITEDEISLGRFNVFIGANGSGKSNVLEILALAGAGRLNNLNFDALYDRGIRMARPNLILSSFSEGISASSIDIAIQYSENNKINTVSNSFTPTDPGDIYSKWVDLGKGELLPNELLDYFRQITAANPQISGQNLLDEANKIMHKDGRQETISIDNFLGDYAIFDINTKSLRGISPVENKKKPLGLNGEGLDTFISLMSKKDRQYLELCKGFFNWLEEIVIDKEDKLKLSGLKPGRSISTLYFTDKFMQSHNKTLSAENSNEGILHVLFYLSLFLSKKTPKLIGIDNIETALNPRLCQALITELAKLSIETGKQALITTHNPAVLDGINLLDDDQRLFEVFRNSEGHTKTRRIKFKTDLSNKKYKLSEMWMKGLLGAVPENF